MTKKDYELIAVAITNAKLMVEIKKITKSQRIQQHNGISEVVIRLMGVLKGDNKKFNGDKFVKACNKY